MIKRIRGFTLVELLIVIALLAAIALIVIAAINPIEQSNRARDTRFASDSGQMVSALERYYATRSQYPWIGTGGGQRAASNEAAYPYVTAGDEGVGVCGASCAVDGVLINNNELKQEFRNRDFIRDQASTDPTKVIKIGKAQGSNASVYACYVPLSNSSRQKACAESDVYTLSGDGSRTAVTPATCASATWDNTWNVCLPQ